MYLVDVPGFGFHVRAHYRGKCIFFYHPVWHLRNKEKAIRKLRLWLEAVRKEAIESLQIPVNERMRFEDGDIVATAGSDRLDLPDGCVEVFL